MHSNNLYEIDLSWCKTARSTWTNFFRELKSNKTLQKLALIGNFIIENNQFGQETLENIITFIKKNRVLQHIDFTACGLFSEELKQIGSALCRSGSLQAIHLCMNPGLDESVIEYLSTRIKARPFEERPKMPIYREKNSKIAEQDILDS